MHIELSKEQYRELMKSFLTGQYVREDVAVSKSEPFKKERSMEAYLLSFAPDFGAEDVCVVKGHELLPAPELEKECFEMMDDYDNDRFWLRLEQDLAERDLWDSADQTERRAIDASGLWPERVKKIAQTYHREFRSNGLKHLRVQRDAMDVKRRSRYGSEEV